MTESRQRQSRPATTEATGDPVGAEGLSWCCVTRWLVIVREATNDDLIELSPMSPTIYSLVPSS